MAVTLEILDLADSEQIQLTLVDESGNRESAPPVSFPFPLTDEELVEIAWLFTEYPSEPFGESPSRAEAIQTGLRNLGRLMMEAVFRSGAEAAEISAKVISSGKIPFRLSIVSERPEFLTLPWELINDPDVGYLAAQAESLTRQPTATSELRELAGASLSERQFNVLMLCPPRVRRAGYGSAERHGIAGCRGVSGLPARLFAQGFGRASGRKRLGITILFTWTAFRLKTEAKRCGVLGL